MKLTDKLIPSQYKVDDNEVYRLFQLEINKALRTTVLFDYNRARVENGCFNYTLTEDEVDFHKNIYVPFGRVISDDFNLISQFGEQKLKELNIGDNEAELLNMLFSNYPLIFVMGSIGWGKTSFLEHVFLYLSTQSSDLISKIVPVYMVLDQIPALQKNYEETDTVIEEFHEKYLDDYLKHYIASIIDFNDEALFEYVLNSEGFAEHKFELKFLEAQKPTAKIKQAILEKKLEINRETRFAYSAFEYLRDTQGRIPILIYDNVDPLHEKIQNGLLQDAINLAQTYKFKIIFPIRPVNYKALRKQIYFPLEFQYHKIELKPVNMRNFTERRIQAVMSYINNKREALRTEEGTFRLKFEDPVRALEAMLKILLNEDSILLLNNITNHDKRRLCTMIDTYLATGFVRNWGFYRNIMQGIISDDGNDKFKNTLRVLLSSVITGNYETHFSNRATTPIPDILENIINIYCNNKNGEYSINPCLLRLHLLNYIFRHDRCSYEMVLSSYIELNQGPEKKLSECVSRALYRLFQGQLIETPENVKYREEKDVAKAKNINITQTGQYYLSTFRNYYEYISFMKDDIDLPLDTEIKSNVQVTERKDRWNEMVNIVEFLENAEEEFLQTLDSRKKREHYISNFTYPNGNFIFNMFLTTDMLINYGNQTDYNIDRLQSLKKKMIEYMEKFKLQPAKPVGKRETSS